MSNIDERYLKELQLAASPLPWVSHDGRVWWNDENDDPHLRPETMIARFGREDRNKTDSQYTVAAANAIPELLEKIEKLQATILDGRSNTARLMDCIENVIADGLVDSIGEKQLQNAITEWEETLTKDGVKIQKGPTVFASGVQTDAATL